MFLSPLIESQDFSKQSQSYSELIDPRLLDDNLRNLLLPTIYIHPINDELNIKCRRFKERSTWLIHDKDILLHRWLRNVYPKTVLNASLAELTFLPVYTFGCYKDHGMQGETWAWNLINDIISRGYTNTYQKRSISVLDNTFIMASHPSGKPEWAIKLPNLLGIRYLRVDNYRSYNGRDLFTPYITNITDFFKAELINKKKDHFLFMPCKLAPAGMDNNREFRVAACKNIGNVSNSIITAEKIHGSHFVNYLRSTNFCIVLPGDTPGTAKVYKSLMAGCIPVYFISYKAQMPHSDFIDWSKFSILVQKEVVHDEKKMKSLVRYLDYIQNDEKVLAKYQKNLLTAMMFFNFDRVEWPSIYEIMLLEVKLTSGCGSSYSNDFPKVKKLHANITEKLCKYLC